MEASIATPFCIGQGNPQETLSEEAVRSLLARAFQEWNLRDQRLLVIVPDGTRTAPIPLFFHLIHELVGEQVRALDILVALGTHSAMSDEALNRLLGITQQERLTRYAAINIFNHRWDLPETFVEIGRLSPTQTAALSQGMLSTEVPVRVNRKVLDYDLVLVCGPVFPHEVVGFSGGNKYFFPGISGPEVIDFTHWLGALLTSYAIIGTPDTTVRQVIDQAASLLPTPRRLCALVCTQQGLHGLYLGDMQAAWRAAADLSAQVHVRYLPRPFRQVLAVMPEMYDDLWTGAKGMYKLEPVVADGGEVIIYAPHITEVSYTHGRVIDQVGYHVRDYFLAQWEQFKGYPWGVLAHSTHVRGMGTYVNGVERPRIQVTLATGIPPERCRKINLGYRDPASIDPSAWADREDEGILLVPHAGEMLYRLR